MISISDLEFVCVTSLPKHANLANRIRTTGYVAHDRMWEVLADASVLLHPIRSETFGRIILESLANGTPVITTPLVQHISLALPLKYASTVSEMRDELLELYGLWKNNRREYDNLCEIGASIVKKYDKVTLLPKFEMMFEQVAKDMR